MHSSPVPKYRKTMVYFTLSRVILHPLQYSKKQWDSNFVSVDFNSLRTSHTQGSEEQRERESDTSFQGNWFFLFFPLMQLLSMGAYIYIVKSPLMAIQGVMSKHHTT